MLGVFGYEQQLGGLLGQFFYELQQAEFIEFIEHQLLEQQQVFIVEQRPQLFLFEQFFGDTSKR